MELNLPKYDFRFRTSEGKQYIFDAIRKKYIRLTPEEWVRQNFVRFLIQDKNYPSNLLRIEMSLTVNQLQRRCDAALFNNKGEPLMIVECKAPDVKISQDTFDQIVQYNMKLKVRFLVVTNGMDHFCCQIDYKNGQYQFLKEVPDYAMIK